MDRSSRRDGVSVSYGGGRDRSRSPIEMETESRCKMVDDDQFLQRGGVFKASQQHMAFKIDARAVRSWDKGIRFINSLGGGLRLSSNAQGSVDLPSLVKEFESAFECKDVEAAELSAKKLINNGVRCQLRPGLIRECYQNTSPNNDRLCLLLFMVAGFSVMQNHVIEDFLPKYSVCEYLQIHNPETLKKNREHFRGSDEDFESFVLDLDEKDNEYLIANYCLGSDGKIMPFTCFISKFMLVNELVKSPQEIYKKFKEYIEECKFMDVLKRDLVEYQCIVTILKKFIEKQIFMSVQPVVFMWPFSSDFVAFFYLSDGDSKRVVRHLGLVIQLIDYLVQEKFDEANTFLSSLRSEDNKGIGRHTGSIMDLSRIGKLSHDEAWLKYRNAFLADSTDHLGLMSISL